VVSDYVTDTLNLETYWEVMLRGLSKREAPWNPLSPPPPSPQIRSCIVFQSYVIIIIVFPKKVTTKYTKKSTRVGTIVKVLKQAGVVHEIKSLQIN